MISEMGKNESCELLRRQSLGRLGCCADGVPYVIPVNYLYDDDCLYVHSLPGRKIALMRHNPQVCLQTDEIQDEYNWCSVIAFGRYEEITETTEREKILGSLFKRLPHLTPVESRMTKGLPEAIVFRIRIERITGVSEHWQQ
ncbi:MAG TPA: pyridoxamine 5'-phosphate oxidase family protein [Blastocatellia bacterium]|nr:pyridoxamine 5'-phosphate oxidase family protein [Blastocatellia bacterium]